MNDYTKPKLREIIDNFAKDIHDKKQKPHLPIKPS
jgi:hypothetical protein